MSKSYAIGVAAALFATFSWALNFLSPYLMGDFGTFDFITLRFIVSGAIGLAMLRLYRAGLARLNGRTMATAALLGVVGYTLYIGCVMGSVLNGGAIIAPAFLSAAPIMVALIGNLIEPTVSWRALCVPVLLALLGLVATNYGAFAGVLDGDLSTYLQAVGYAVGATLSWLIFSLLNQVILARLPHVSSGLWTGLMMVGAGLSVVLFVPFGLTFDLYSAPHVEWLLDNTLPVLAAASALACVASVGGAWAWNFASQRLPLALSGQLISVETLFAAAFGLIAEQRLPTALETLGIIALLSGASIAVRVMAHHQRAGASVRA
ncbi:DMT family transporter [Pseudomonas protegens]|uniref:DMT family transporter n=1 Tax=Pseudomonas protegens TaxID=380021 RepID=UPI0021C74BE8|nr:DMT family transporter [Pseudomonas protegens]MCU1769836.1 DMT family transporter [Pseudomonas protegens]